MQFRPMQFRPMQFRPMQFRDEHGRPVTQKDGLLWVDGKIVELPMADRIAAINGFHCAERLVQEMTKPEAEQRNGWDR